MELNVSGVGWPVVSALCQVVCPCLRLLDLSRVEDLKDSHLRELLGPPPDPRTGEWGRGLVSAEAVLLSSDPAPAF